MCVMLFSSNSVKNVDANLKYADFNGASFKEIRNQKKKSTIQGGNFVSVSHSPHVFNSLGVGFLLLDVFCILFHCCQMSEKWITGSERFFFLRRKYCSRKKISDSSDLSLGRIFNTWGKCNFQIIWLIFIQFYHLQIRKIQELFHGRFTEWEVRILLDEKQWDSTAVVNYVFCCELRTVAFHILCTMYHLHRTRKILDSGS